MESSRVEMEALQNTIESVKFTQTTAPNQIYQSITSFIESKIQFRQVYSDLIEQNQQTFIQRQKSVLDKIAKALLSLQAEDNSSTKLGEGIKLTRDLMVFENSTIEEKGIPFRVQSNVTLESIKAYSSRVISSHGSSRDVLSSF